MKTELIVIRTASDYQAARAMLATLMDATSEEDGAQLRAQAAIVADYEATVAPIRDVDPVDAIKFRMEQLGLKPSALAEIIGSKSRVSEILNRRRPLSLAMIRRLHEKLDIPAEILIRAA